MSAYHAPLNAYEEYIVRKRMSEAPTLADTKELPVIRLPREDMTEAVLFAILFGPVIGLLLAAAWVWSKLGLMPDAPPPRY